MALSLEVSLEWPLASRTPSTRSVELSSSRWQLEKVRNLTKRFQEPFALPSFGTQGFFFARTKTGLSDVAQPLQYPTFLQYVSSGRENTAAFITVLNATVLTILVIGLNINHNDPSLFTAYSDSDVAVSSFRKLACVPVNLLCFPRLHLLP